MSAPFVATLRARPGTIEIGPPDATAITIRAQLAEAWDAVRIRVSPDESIANVKARALEVLAPAAVAMDQYVVSFRGFEILDESISLSAARVVNGATLLIQFRHRRPVR